MAENGANPIKKFIAAVDGWQRRHGIPAVGYGVTKKFGDDNANLYVVALGWYGFTAIYPLLLVVITVFGFIGEDSLGTGIVHTLHQFPVIGSQFNPAGGGSSLHGSTVGLVIGVVGLIYGAQGVTQTAQQAMARVWNVPDTERPGFAPRLARSLAGLAAIGLAFLANAILAPIATGHGIAMYIRALIIIGMLVLNCGFFLASWRALTAARVSLLQLVPGCITAAVGFTALITVGAGLVQHQLRHSSATYGAFAAVIGLVTFLLLLAKLTLYSAELNPVLARGLWPRALPTCSPTRADNEVLRGIVHEQRRRPDQRIGVGFGEDASDQAADDVADQEAAERDDAYDQGQSGRSRKRSRGGMAHARR
jgi:uncharacterized BrkB/YihY/UPF0761 family membrane protein